MPRPTRRTPRHRTTYGRQHIFQLLVGFDFFHDAFGRDMDAMRRAWADPEVKQRVYDLLEQRKQARLGVRRVPWAEETFGK